MPLLVPVAAAAIHFCRVAQRCVRGLDLAIAAPRRSLTAPSVCRPGFGANNYRDWETLLAGAIPLVDYVSYNEELWDRLPVVQVRDWAKITPAYLEEELSKMRARASEFNLAKAYLPYWLSKVVEG